MPITYDWLDNEKTILYVKFVDEWEWSDYIPIQKTLAPAFEGNPKPIDAIADFSETAVIPIGALTIGRNVFNSRAANSGMVIAIGTSAQLRMLVHSLLMVCPPARERFLWLATLDEALEKLSELRQNP